MYIKLLITLKNTAVGFVLVILRPQFLHLFVQARLNKIAFFEIEKNIH